MQLWEAEARPGLEFRIALANLADSINRQLASAAQAGGFAVFGDYQVVAAACRTDGDLQPSALAKSLGITMAGVTGRLDRLERQGLIDRERRVDDRRTVVVRATPAGRERFEYVTMSLRALDAQIESEVSESDIESMCAALDRIRAQLPDGGP
jgi:DNA-binding MarR family transcriptional regulator